MAALARRTERGAVAAALRACPHCPLLGVKRTSQSKGMSAFDPKGHRPASHVAVAKPFSPYQSTRLSRYDAAS